MTNLAPKERVLPTSGGDYELFRSTLEFRWALAFEFLKIEWHYEPNRFPLPNGTYLPDFYLPEIGWIEIKPTFEELKEAEAKLRTFARYKSELLDEDLPFYSINSPSPTFRFSRGSRESVLLEWLPNGEIRLHGRDYAMDTFRSQDHRVLYETNRDTYVDFADRVMSLAREGHIDEPLPINAVMTLSIRSMRKTYVEASETDEEDEIILGEKDEHHYPF